MLVQKWSKLYREKSKQETKKTKSERRFDNRGNIEMK